MYIIAFGNVYGGAYHCLRQYGMRGGKANISLRILSQSLIVIC